MAGVRHGAIRPAVGVADTALIKVEPIDTLSRLATDSFASPLPTHLLPSSEAARIIADSTDFDPHLKWLHTMAATGILTDHGPGMHHRFDADELAEFLTTHP